jgi:hypothetical protein
MDIDDIETDTITTSCESIDQLVSMLSEGSQTSAKKLVIKTPEGNTVEIHGEGGIGVWIREKDEC